MSRVSPIPLLTHLSRLRIGQQHRHQPPQLLAVKVVLHVRLAQAGVVAEDHLTVGGWQFTFKRWQLIVKGSENATNVNFRGALGFTDRITVMMALPPVMMALPPVMMALPPVMMALPPYPRHRSAPKSIKTHLPEEVKVVHPECGRWWRSLPPLLPLGAWGGDDGLQEQYKGNVQDNQRYAEQPPRQNHGRR